MPSIPQMTPLWTLSFSPSSALKLHWKSSEDWKYPTVTHCSGSPLFIGMISCSLVGLVMRIWLLGAGEGVTWATAGLGWPAVTPLMRDMEMGPAGLQQVSGAAAVSSSHYFYTRVTMQHPEHPFSYIIRKYLNVYLSARKIILPNFRYQIIFNR